MPTNGETNPRERYKELCIDAYPIMKWANTHLSHRSKIMLVRESGDFYLECDFIWINPFSQKYINFLDWAQYGGFKQITDKGITHVLINKNYLLQFNAPDASVLIAELPYNAVLIKSINNVELWEVVKANRTVPVVTNKTY